MTMSEMKRLWEQLSEEEQQRVLFFGEPDTACLDCGGRGYFVSRTGLRRQRSTRMPMNTTTGTTTGTGNPASPVISATAQRTNTVRS
jgi:hypothetical protein